jgi:hypothetical protein
LQAAVSSQDERRERLQKVIDSDVMPLLLSGKFDEAERLARSLLGLDT